METFCILLARSLKEIAPLIYVPAYILLIIWLIRHWKN